MPSQELGEKLVRSQIERLGEMQRGLLESHRPQRGWQPPTLNDLEALWVRFERLTRKYWVASQTLDEYMNHKQIKFPGWEALSE